jgi:putative ABC transport system substrate-binding protein
MTTRRRFLLASALSGLGLWLSGPSSTLAQQRSVRVGVLIPLPRSKAIPVPSLVRRLDELGYRENAGMVLEYRSAEGSVDRFPKLARELIELRCDLIFAIGPEQAARAMREARSAIPVVILAIDYDPVEKGVIANLRQPEGSMTGVYLPQASLAVKRMEIAREVVPAAKRFLVLADVYSQDQLKAVKAAADKAALSLTVVDFTREPYDFGAAFESGRRAGVEALIGLTSPVFAANGVELAAFLAQHRLPSVGFFPRLAEEGFLLSYGADIVKAARRVADIGVRILKGVKPSDIPVEQSDEYELVVNLKTAKALGVKIPYSVLARATRVIE